MHFFIDAPSQFHYPVNQTTTLGGGTSQSPTTMSHAEMNTNVKKMDLEMVWQLHFGFFPDPRVLNKRGGGDDGMDPPLPVGGGAAPA